MTTKRLPAESCNDRTLPSLIFARLRLASDNFWMLYAVRLLDGTPLGEVYRVGDGTKWEAVRHSDLETRRFPTRREAGEWLLGVVARRSEP